MHLLFNFSLGRSDGRRYHFGYPFVGRKLGLNAAKRQATTLGPANKMDGLQVQEYEVLPTKRRKEAPSTGLLLIGAAYATFITSRRLPPSNSNLKANLDTASDNPKCLPNDLNIR